MERIALVNPGKEGVKKPSISLGYLAAYLEGKGFRIKIVDEQAGENIEQELKNFRPEMVGLTTMTMFSPRAYKILEFARKELNALTVIGGSHPTALSAEAKKHADIVVVGEGEKAMEDIAKGKAKKGIIKGEPLKNLNEVPIPAYHLMNMDYYLKQGDHIAGVKMRSMSISTSRGCPFRCVFCENSVSKSPARFRSVENVIKEIGVLVEKYGVEGLAFTDECFTVNKKRLLEICREMEKRFELKWECQTRADVIDREKVHAMKKSGCVQVAFGFESGSQRILDVLNKGEKIGDYEKAIKACREENLRIRGCFMVGNPTETIEDIRLTEEFIDRHGIDFVGLFLTTPYPGTELWEYCKRNNLIPPNLSWEDLTTGQEVDPFACTTIPKQELKRIYDRLFLKYSLRNYPKRRFIQRALKNPRYTIKTLKKMIENRAAKKGLL